MSRLEQWNRLEHALEYRGNRDIRVYICLESEPETIVGINKVLAMRTKFVDEDLINALCVDNNMGGHAWVSSERIISLNLRPDGNFDLVLTPLHGST